MSLPPPPPPPPPSPGDGGFVGPPLWEPGQPVEVRRLSFSDLLDNASHLYRLHWRSLVGIVALLVVPLQFLEQYLIRNYRQVTFFGRVTNANRSARLAVISLVIALISLLVVHPLLAGAVARAVAGFHLGERPTAGRVLDYGLSYIGPVFAVVFLSTLATIAGLIAFVIPGIYIAIRLTFAPIAAVIEGKRGVDALRRSWELMRDHFWRVFGILLVVGLILGVVGALVTVPTTLGADALGRSGWWLRASGAAVAAVFTRPFALIVQVLLYFDVRVRGEGFTLERLRREITGEWAGF